MNERNPNPWDIALYAFATVTAILVVLILAFVVIFYFNSGPGEFFD